MSGCIETHDPLQECSEEFNPNSGNLANGEKVLEFYQLLSQSNRIIRTCDLEDLSCDIATEKYENSSSTVLANLLLLDCHFQLIQVFSWYNLGIFLAINFRFLWFVHFLQSRLIDMTCTNCSFWWWNLVHNSINFIRLTDDFVCEIVLPIQEMLPDMAMFWGIYEFKINARFHKHQTTGPNEQITLHQLWTQ